MSASSKKKLRTDSEKLTERQREEQKQAKEVKLYTIGFVAVMAVILVIAILVGTQQLIANSGVRERKTVAYTVGDHALSNTELNYFFSDTVNNFVNQYGSYAAMFGLDTSKPLDQQYVDAENTRTWADDFMDSAKGNATAVYTVADAAKAAGHTLSEEELAQVDTVMANLKMYASISGHGSVKSYLKAVYGSGATEESYRAYLETSILADSYRAAYAEALTYDDAALREAEKDNYSKYSSFTYNQYVVDASKFLTGGTTDEDGKTTYSDEEKDASVKAAEAAAKALIGENVKTVADFDQAIAEMEINKEAEGVSSTPFANNDYRRIPEDVAKWLSDASRKEGDKTVIANTSVRTDDEGNETTVTTGYTVVFFLNRNDNTELLPNVRHILVGFEGGTQNEQGQTVYSDEEKAAAKEKAESLLKQFTEGEATEEAFAALATENTTDPGSKENGGLYENIYPGQMVSAFNDWCFESGRKAGDTGIVETSYGYHVMYYCGEGSLSYRDLQITQELTAQDVDTWYKGLIDSAVTVDGDTSRIRTNLTLNRQ